MKNNVTKKNVTIFHVSVIVDVAVSSPITALLCENDRL